MFNFLKRPIILRKKDNEDALNRLKVLFYLKEKGKETDLILVYTFLHDSDWNVRNAAASTLLELIEVYPEHKENTLNHLHDLIEISSLSVKLVVLEILGKMQDYSSKEIIAKILEESDYDLQYAAIRSIGFLDDVDVLHSLKNVIYVKDYITRRAAIHSIIRITKSVKEDNKLEQLTPHIHLLVEAYIELGELKDIVYKIFDFGDSNLFPEMRGYSEYEIIRLEALLNENDYSVEAYQNFARLIYPLYFPVKNEKI